EAPSLFGRNDRCEGPELLAILDVPIEPVPDSRRMRCGEDAPVTERARAKLQRSIHPTDNLPGGKIVGGHFDQLAFIDIIGREAIFIGQLNKVVGVDRWSPKGMIWKRSVRIAEANPVGVERGT